MLDKSKFFFLGATLFLGVSRMLYPIMDLKMRKQVLVKDMPCFKLIVPILRHEVMATQMSWVPIDVMSKRLMVQGGNCAHINGRIDAFKKINQTEGVRGLYRGFRISIITYAPSNLVWWVAYSMSMSCA
ncbi:hypothetical protein L2E82_06805 [Cichorium intybus]|uniref:Uncharacterized protein n=1 Tax=Cichorium intybus TaxID=13427 RepID=A0ACB9HDA4_CICIN|nr:hypothetical protein L2E82_06805 [Cichorium intybus]